MDDRVVLEELLRIVGFEVRHDIFEAVDAAINAVQEHQVDHDDSNFADDCCHVAAETEHR